MLFTLWFLISQTREVSSRSKRDNIEIWQKKANSVAWSPSSQIIMTLLMFWMTGSSLNIFTIIMIGSLIATPIRGLMNVDKGSSLIGLMEYLRVHFAVYFEDSFWN